MVLTINSVSFNAKNKTLLSIDQLKIKPGKLTGLIGPNGSGKSTLLKLIGGDLTGKGSILFHGKELKHWHNIERAKHVAVLPQFSQLIFPFTAYEVVALGLIPLSINHQEGKKQIHKKMEATHCLHLAQQSYPSLSGGEQQRVQLARVLLQLSQATATPLLLLDEPIAAQDLGQQHYILQLVKELCIQNEYTVITSLHDLNQVLRYCEEYVLLKAGKMVQHGHPKQLLSEEMIKNNWQYKPNIINTNNNQAFIL